MKKITFILITLLSFTIVTGCNNRKTVTRFTSEKETTETTKKPETIVKVKNTTTAETKPTPIVIKEETKVEKEPKGAKETKEIKKEVKEVPFEITTLDKNTSDSKKGYQLIEGTTPATTAKIMVNNTALSKYKSGDTKWSYIAAVSLGNLKKGKNEFTIQALDKDNKELASKTLTINYEGTESPTLINTGANIPLLAGFLTLVVLGILYYKPSIKTTL